MTNLGIEGNPVSSMLVAGEGGNTSSCRYRYVQSVIFVLLFSFSGFVNAAYRPVLIVGQDCVVSILNRTITPNAAGKFELANVPSFMGQVGKCNAPY